MYNAFVDGKLVTVLNATQKNTSFPIAQGLASQTHSVLITKRTGIVVVGGEKERNGEEGKVIGELMWCIYVGRVHGACVSECEKVIWY